MMNDEIISIEYMGLETGLVDIVLDGDRLFYANDILTHNSGVNNSDPDITDTSDSMGITFTADLMLALVSNEELAKVNQILCKQLKNRYSDLNDPTRFIIGIDKTKMRLYDAEEQVNDTPAFDKTQFGRNDFDGDGIKSKVKKIQGLII